MSYSFSARGSKAEVMAKVASELNKVVEAQPVHAADRVSAEAAVQSFVDLLPDAPDKDVSVSVSGSVGWDGVDAKVLHSAGVSVSVGLVAKETA